MCGLGVVVGGIVDFIFWGCEMYLRKVSWDYEIRASCKQFECGLGRSFCFCTRVELLVFAYSLDKILAMYINSIRYSPLPSSSMQDRTRCT